MRLESPGFENGQAMPTEYLLDGDNHSPPLRIHDIPGDAQSLALIMEDIDSPIGFFTHWVVWNLPPETREIVENSLPAGAHTGMNGFGAVRYDGPCPPSGRHRYRFRLVALDQMLEATSPDRKDHIEEEMAPHIISEAELTGICDASDST